ncbi:MAG TPA: hypothetical protein VLH75_15295 [Longimicrobiales bacterium]|nr:hypothetical protein [Longimicrobiales bacterium]
MRGRGVCVIVAYYAPPAAGVAVNRLVAMVRHLPALGWDPVLVAPSLVHHHRSTGDEGALAGVTVVRVTNPEPSRLFRRLAGSTAAGESGSGGFEELLPLETGAVGSWARRLVREWLYVPDAQALWIPFAARAAAAAIRGAAGRAAVLFSTSVPYSCHFAARTAAVDTGVPWVAEYRDPWSVAPPQFGSRSALRQMIDRRLDHGVATRADRLVVTSERTRTLFLEAFRELPVVRTAVVRNGFEDPGVPPSAPPASAGPLRLAYAGSLLDVRWATVFVDALSELAASEPGAVMLDVHGFREPWTALAAGRPDGAPWLRIHGMAPVEQVGSMLQASSALVLLQPDAVSYVPGKTYDYLGARRPVLADVPPGSETALLLGRFGEFHSLSGLDVRGVVGVLEMLLTRHRMGALALPSVPEHTVAGLSRRAQVAILGSVFDEVTGR